MLVTVIPVTYNVRTALFLSEITLRIHIIFLYVIKITSAENLEKYKKTRLFVFYWITHAFCLTYFSSLALSFGVSWLR